MSKERLIDIILKNSHWLYEPDAFGHNSTMNMDTLSDAILKEFVHKDEKEFYIIRMNELQKKQIDFREPERTIVCNILANGKGIVLKGDSNE